MESDISEGYIWVLHSDDSGLLRHGSECTSRDYERRAYAPLIVRGDVDIKADGDEDDEEVGMLMPNESEIIELDG